MIILFEQLSFLHKSLLDILNSISSTILAFFIHFILIKFYLLIFKTLTGEFQPEQAAIRHFVPYDLQV